jgi:hypothetical protein
VPASDLFTQARQRREPETRERHRHRPDDLGDAPPQIRVRGGEPVQGAPRVHLAAVEDLREDLVAS